MTTPRATCSPARFLEVMAHVATPVAVVTAIADGRPHGTTVSAFASLSLDPPMVLLSLARTSELLTVVRSTGRFGVNILGSTHSTWAGAFARKGGEAKFAGISWSLSDGVPRLPGAGWIAGSVAELADGGDHVVVPRADVRHARRPGGDVVTHDPTALLTRSPAAAVQRAVAALGAGGMVVVTDDEDREDEGDLVLAAEHVTAAQMAFLVRHTTGIVCAPMLAARADALQLPPMVADNRDAHGTAFTVSVDAAHTGTGVSAADRARTAAALAGAATTASQLRRPGHVFPLRARDGGVLVRAGHTEAAVDLVTMAGLSGVAVISEIVDDDGSMRRGGSLADFAAEHGLPVLSIADLVRHRLLVQRQVVLVATAHMPTEFGDFRAMAYRSELDGVEHLALVMGDIATAGGSTNGVLARVHSECLTGDILGSLRCDCGAQLEQALRAVAEEGCGVVVYLRGHEGRGIGLAHKVRAYALQDDGLDTVDANTAQGLPVDSRSYGTGAQILTDLGVHRLRLITNNMAKYGGLEGHGLHIVSRVAMPSAETPHNVRYLRTKRDRMGHRLGTTSVGTGAAR